VVVKTLVGALHQPCDQIGLPGKYAYDGPSAKAVRATTVPGPNWSRRAQHDESMEQEIHPNLVAFGSSRILKEDRRHLRKAIEPKVHVVPAEIPRSTPESKNLCG
jgi:hypothetical protein